MEFADRFDPQNGDVIYGITSVRNDYLLLLIKRRKEDAVLDGENPDNAAKDYSKFLEKNCFIQIDRLNNESGLANREHYMTDDQALLQGQKKFTGHFGLAQAKYAQSIGNTRFSPATVFNAPKEKLAKEGHQATNFPKGNSDAMALAFNRLYLAIRKACKYGLFYITTNFKRAKIHFALDDIVMGEVVKKGARDKLGDSEVANNVHCVPITTSELRCCYRHWRKIKDRVFFYNNGGTDAQAPWDADKGLWDTYGQYLVSKYLTRLEKAKTAFGIIYKQKEDDIARHIQAAEKFAKANQPHEAVMELQEAIDFFPDALRSLV
jgi:hypothetical protein